MQSPMTFAANGIFQGQMEVLAENGFPYLLTIVFHILENYKKDNKSDKCTHS